MGLEDKNIVYKPPRIVFRVSKDKSQVSYIVKPHPNILGVDHGYLIQPLIFEDPEAQQKYSAELHLLRPYCAKTPSLIEDRELKCLELVVGGSGTLLAITPDFPSKTLVGRFNEGMQRDINPTGISLSFGWYSTWVAGEKGLTVLRISNPPFRQEMEAQATQIHHRLADKYDSLVGRRTYTPGV